MRTALVLVVLASCWRGGAEPIAEPGAELAPHYAALAEPKDPPRRPTHPAPAIRSTAPGAGASSPGPLTLDHQAWDDPAGCGQCHVNNSRQVDKARCLGCHDHDPLAARITAGRGFHVSAGVNGKACESCHHEHKGRGYDLMGWKSIGGIAKFDHALTSWPLPAAYRAARCTTCHTTVDQQGLQLYLGADRALYP